MRCAEVKVADMLLCLCYSSPEAEPDVGGTEGRAGRAHGPERPASLGWDERVHPWSRAFGPGARGSPASDELGKTRTTPGLVYQVRVLLWKTVILDFFPKKACAEVSVRSQVLHYFAKIKA